MLVVELEAATRPTRSSGQKEGVPSGWWVDKDEEWPKSSSSVPKSVNVSASQSLAGCEWWRGYCSSGSWLLATPPSRTALPPRQLLGVSIFSWTRERWLIDDGPSSDLVLLDKQVVGVADVTARIGEPDGCDGAGRYSAAAAAAAVGQTGRSGHQSGRMTCQQTPFFGWMINKPIFSIHRSRCAMVSNPFHHVIGLVSPCRRPPQLRAGQNRETFVTGRHAIYERRPPHYRLWHTHTHKQCLPLLCCRDFLPSVLYHHL